MHKRAFATQLHKISFWKPQQVFLQPLTPCSHANQTWWHCMRHPMDFLVVFLVLAAKIFVRGPKTTGNVIVGSSVKGFQVQTARRMQQSPLS
jgi:hypothetical protein